MKEKYIALVSRATNPFIVLGNFTGIMKARNYAEKKKIKFLFIMSAREWEKAAVFYVENA